MKHKPVSSGTSSPEKASNKLGKATMKWGGHGGQHLKAGGPSKEAPKMSKL